METPISTHMGRYHFFDVLKMTFFEYVPDVDRGGDIDRILLQRESKWIHTLATTVHPGLKESLSFKPFL